ncbi:MAG: hypothetical protein LBE75_07415 [Burkholderiales bacterium]|nr:hypothetical protein [Burkholderiales bacterium]
MTTLSVGIAPSLHAASVTYADPNCDSFELQNNGGGSFTLVCVPGGGGGPTVPSGCSIAPAAAINLENTGGPISLTGSCTGNVVDGSTVYSWTRSGGSGGTQTYSGASVAHNLPANTGTSAITYIYTFKACNETTACTSVTKSATVAAASGGGDTGIDYCPSGGFKPEIAWGNTQLSANAGNGVLAVRFTVPSNVSTNLMSIGVAEFEAPATMRNITISKNACDFNDGSLIVPRFVSQYSQKFSTATGTGNPKLESGQTYYINIRNQRSNGTASCATGNCNMLIKMGVFAN